MWHNPWTAIATPQPQGDLQYTDLRSEPWPVLFPFFVMSGGSSSQPFTRSASHGCSCVVQFCGYGGVVAVVSMASWQKRVSTQRAGCIDPNETNETNEWCSCCCVLTSLSVRHIRPVPAAARHDLLFICPLFDCCCMIEISAGFRQQINWNGILRVCRERSGDWRDDKAIVLLVGISAGPYLARPSGPSFLLALRPTARGDGVGRPVLWFPLFAICFP
jgi:hypothetical protein